uniref:Uncharacterized protein n=1 Tax=Arundo donax TaxID=35708 RepID=A0A0A9EZM8_ARUDO
MKWPCKNHWRKSSISGYQEVKNTFLISHMKVSFFRGSLKSCTFIFSFMNNNFNDISTEVVYHLDGFRINLNHYK